MSLFYSTTPDLAGSGPTITVRITPSSALLSVLTDPAEIAKYSKSFSANMLIDTGSSVSMIDLAIAPFLGLRKHGEDKIITPSGEKVCLTYDIDLTFMKHANFTFKNIRVVESDFKATQGHDGLIGRDILKSALFIYQGWGNQFTLAF